MYICRQFTKQPNNSEDMPPKVSVIVPNYNYARYLKARIDSILNQTFQDFELILLDDCSTDNSAEVLEGYRTHPLVAHLVVNTQNTGSPFAQWFRGIGLAQGEYIWIAESDDLAEPTFLETTRRAPALRHGQVEALAAGQACRLRRAGLHRAQLLLAQLHRQRQRRPLPHHGAGHVVPRVAHLIAQADDPLPGVLADLVAPGQGPGDRGIGDTGSLCHVLQRYTLHDVCPFRREPAQLRE